MRSLKLLFLLTFICGAGFGADWLTDGGDSKRAAWQRDETIFTKENVSNMKLLWKLKLENEPRQMHSLFPPLIAERVQTSDGIKEIAMVTGVSDNLYGIDAKTGKLLWKHHFENTYEPEEGARPHYTLCPGGIMATPVIGPTGTPGKYTIYAASWDGRLHFLNLADGKPIRNTRELIDYVVDRSTVKQGKYTPGTNLEIVAPERLLEEMPDYTLLLTWNFAGEILRQQEPYRRAGGRFIVPLPHVHIV